MKYLAVLHHGYFQFPARHAFGGVDGSPERLPTAQHISGGLCQGHPRISEINLFGNNFIQRQTDSTRDLFELHRGRGLGDMGRTSCCTDTASVGKRRKKVSFDESLYAC
jgi:hypothetical protein